MRLTAVYLPVPEGFVGFVEELPGANTQGATMDEARENPRDAVRLILESRAGNPGRLLRPREAGP